MNKEIEDADAAQAYHKVKAHQNGGVGTSSQAVETACADLRDQDKNIPQWGKTAKAHHPTANDDQCHPKPVEDAIKELSVRNEKVPTDCDQAESEDGDRVGDEEEHAKDPAEGVPTPPVEVKVGVHREGLQDSTVEKIGKGEVHDQDIEPSLQLLVQCKGQHSENVPHCPHQGNDDAPGDTDIAVIHN